MDTTTATRTATTTRANPYPSVSPAGTSSAPIRRKVVTGTTLASVARHRYSSPRRSVELRSGG
ncbi:hypothetical protein Mkiyose1665_54680 [Mycobacterium kiyosense]|uniref:Uncharacterized protein n=1 Tax=Mycobacterium kiyosense TaxID=2871094 RepID=A0A9P3V0R6_9MYCO|nr:hypothetical protein IWGMT90018_11810 [Mycobacterium kiyosense]BDE12538.1 hypothetical protein MKCMC460_13980 [Mycobacterium sp. 20KCMC460]GLB85843.1 hypothetical protein SRL2020028_50990 [Mycobacterium kiyosense]GLB91026.1 hypothetical protein SRL2020130_38430 [Mycobacterium kiyosense]GLC04873.1 hypothetical protein SRL2020400_54640 [Mycobacterium kiyosense]